MEKVLPKVSVIFGQQMGCYYCSFHAAPFVSGIYQIEVYKTPSVTPFTL